MNMPVMFLSDVSVVDHAFIDNEGKKIGGSFNPCFLVGGKIDPVEKVVVDFSTVKKSIKAIIDDKQTGFDHKLWIIDGWSKCDMSFSTTIKDGVEHLQCYIITPYVSLSLPANAVKVCIPNNPDLFDYYHYPDVAELFDFYVGMEMRKVYPNIDLTIKTEITETKHHIFKSDEHRSDLIEFRYTHGLKDSTSWGCQNIAHGHLSYMFVRYSEPRSESLYSDTYIRHNVVNHQLISIAQELENIVFINKENVFGESESQIELRYTTPRGDFSELINKADINHVVLDTETTIEFLVGFIKSKLDPDFIELYGLTELYVSEGLSKGAMISL